ncbi:probable 3-dehydroquinate synthase [Desulfotalea psychrophila LSv54]|uniref:Probable 3-dehydroquinate synthase n=1 Tax=Desulfotalea psychrophila (strain LSv54 / DSM 12343) TaxID=177439 RepID=Q6AN71_DESPS|nr:probable 3-dehydroquinate synthase [Desulfotalea psychrophila LSv54]
MILTCCSIKAEVVAEDEREGGLRKILNFGHTIGHAIEAESHFSLIHGLAVAIGMVAASRLAFAKGLLAAEEVREVEEIIAGYGLPTEIPLEYDNDNILSYLQVDKKNVAGRVVFVLPERIGATLISDGVTEQEILSVLRQD